MNVSGPFKTFWMGGFECADHLNKSGNRVDLLKETGHLENLKVDYALLKSFNILTCREGLRWSIVEPSPYHYDFSVAKIIIDCGITNGIQQIWDMCHFGFPNDITPLHPHFCQRFTSLCAAFATFYQQNYPGQQLLITPINEVGYLSWSGGEVGTTAPYCKNNGWQVKYALVKAYIEGIKLIKDINPGTLIITTEPLVNIVPKVDAGELEKLSSHNLHLEQYQVMDMLIGQACPELGGHPGLVDIMGLNFYYNNQWIAGTEEFLPWVNENNDSRWRPLSDLFLEVYNRYKIPIILSETSHPGEDRPAWIKFITEEILKTIALGIPFWGVCIYPIIDRPDWDDIGDWHHSGLWDTDFEGDVTLRKLCVPFAIALTQSQNAINQYFDFNLLT